MKITALRFRRSAAIRRRIARGLLMTIAAVLIISGCSRQSSPTDKTKGELRSGKTAESTVADMESAVEFKATLSQNPVVLVDFYADWCQPCKLVKPTIAEIAAQYHGKITAVAVDVDKLGTLASDYGIQAIPTIILFRNGSPQDRLVGLQPKNAYVAAIDRALSAPTHSTTTTH